jgi:DNA-binding response OmpR family regulator
VNNFLKIVVVEENNAEREVTAAALRELGHHVVGVDCAEALEEMTNVIQIDLMVLGSILHGEDGFSLTQRIRLSQPGIGIIILSACNQLPDKVKGYSCGADYYLAKPFALEELGAITQAFFRRLKPVEHAGSTLKLNLEKLTLSGERSEVGLTSHKATLLASFTRAPGQRLENWQLIELLGKGDSDYSKSSLEVQIVRLRNKLKQAGAINNPIKVIRQLGYQLCVPVMVL